MIIPWRKPNFVRYGRNNSIRDNIIPIVLLKNELVSGVLSTSIYFIFRHLVHFICIILDLMLKQLFSSCGLCLSQNTMLVQRPAGASPGQVLRGVAF